MATDDKLKEGIEIGVYESNEELANALKKHVKGEITILCVGTDRSTGDSLGPFIGTILKEQGYKNVIGTISDPVHGQNLEERIKEIPENTTVLAIDSALGRTKNIGKLMLNKGKLHAGSGVGKKLTPIGDFHISGVVNVFGSSDLNFLVLQSTRLNTVLEMAKITANAIMEAYPISKTKKVVI